MTFVKGESLRKHEVYPGMEGQFLHTERATFASWRIKNGTELPPHTHHHEQVTTVTSGRFELTVGEETRILEPGDMAIIPPNISHRGKALADTHAIDVFTPRRDDLKEKYV